MTLTQIYSMVWSMKTAQIPMIVLRSQAIHPLWLLSSRKPKTSAPLSYSHNTLILVLKTKHPSLWATSLTKIQLQQTSLQWTDMASSLPSTFRTRMDRRKSGNSHWPRRRDLPSMKYFASNTGSLMEQKLMETMPSYCRKKELSGGLQAFLKTSTSLFRVHSKWAVLSSSWKMIPRNPSNISNYQDQIAPMNVYQRSILRAKLVTFKPNLKA